MGKDQEHKMIGGDLLDKKQGYDWKRTPAGYTWIRRLFRVVTFVFYHEVRYDIESRQRSHHCS